MFTRNTTAGPGVDASPSAGLDRSDELSGVHFVSGESIVEPFPEGLDVAYIAMGCFWGAERVFWELPGVHTTAVGYSGGFTENVTYEDVCTGRTGHAEVVLVVYDPVEVRLEALLGSFWEGHDPTQGDRQGNDVGSQYRSAIYWTSDAQRLTVAASRDAYQSRLSDAGLGKITTELAVAGEFHYAEEYHQQYLAKNPGGYCGRAGTGVGCLVGLDVDPG